VLHARFPEFFRSGRVGEWQQGIPAHLLELFWELNGQAMQLAGYGER
jgi:hypothetical protein